MALVIINDELNEAGGYFELRLDEKRCRLLLNIDQSFYSLVNHWFLTALQSDP